MPLLTRTVGLTATGGLLALIPIGVGMADAATTTHSATPHTVFVSAHARANAADMSCATAGYSTIAAGVAAVHTNGTVVVCHGTYREGVTLAKPVTLTGQPGAVIEAAGRNNGVHITAANVTLTHLTVQDAIGEGVLVDEADHAVLENNIVQHNDLGGLPTDPVPNSYAECAAAGAVPADCGEGIHLMGSAHSTIAHNVSQNNSGGILISDEGGPAAHNVIKDNVVRNNVLDCGVTVVGHNPAAAPGGVPAPSVAGVFDNTIAGNDISGNGVQGAGAGVVMATGLPGGAVYDNTVERNTISRNGQSAVTVHNHVAGQFMNGNVVTHNVIGVNNLKGDPDAGPIADTRTTGVLVGAAAPLSIEVKNNTIVGDHFGVWTVGPANVAGAERNAFVGVTVPVSHN